MNKIFFRGNITRDGELKTVSVDGVQTPVLNFTVAVNRKFKSGQTKVYYHRVAAWRKFAEALAPYVKKGRPVMVEGFPSSSGFIRSDGTLETYVTVELREIDFLTGLGRMTNSETTETPEVTEEQAE
jgi:single-strand DNA-binding protein